DQEGDGFGDDPAIPGRCTRAHALTGSAPCLPYRMLADPALPAQEAVAQGQSRIESNQLFIAFAHGPPLQSNNNLRPNRASLDLSDPSPTGGNPCRSGKGRLV